MQPTKRELIAKIHDARELLMQVCIVLNAPTAVPKLQRPATPPTPKQPLFVGDTGKLRKALWDCGWFHNANGHIFNDKRKSWSRLKLWFGNKLHEATQVEQEALEEALRAEFGNRIIKMGFTRGMPWANGDCQKQFCIWLKL